MKQYSIGWIEIIDGQAKLRQFATNNQSTAIDLFCYLRDSGKYLVSMRDYGVMI